MRYPNESLEEYRARKLKPIDPPEEVALEFTGETEVLKPLAYWEGPAKKESGSSTLRSTWYWFSWFHRSLALGGALALVTFVVGTGLYLAMYGPPASSDPDVAELGVKQPLADLLTPEAQPSSSDISTADDSPYLFDDVKTEPAPVKRSISRPRAGRVVFRATRTAREPLHPQMWVSQFVPTTLIIYVENGEIKSRIEPQSASLSRKPAVN